MNIKCAYRPITTSRKTCAQEIKMVLWNGMFPAIAVNKDVTVFTGIPASWMYISEPRKNNAAIQQLCSSHQLSPTVRSKRWEAGCGSEQDVRKRKGSHQAISEFLIYSKGWWTWRMTTSCVFRVPPAPQAAVSVNIIIHNGLPRGILPPSLTF